MKTITTLLLIALALPAYAQIPNGGFEEWITVEGIEVPSEPWITNNLQNKPQGVTYNPVTKSSDHYPTNVGSYSIRLENNTAYPSDQGEPMPYWACSYGFTTTAFYLGQTGPVFPVTGHPDSLCGYYKFLPQNGDTMAISAALYDQGQLVAFASFYDTATVFTWKAFSLHFPSYIQADSAQIGFSAFYVGAGYPKGPYGNSILYIDNISFKSEVSALEKNGDITVPGNFALAQNYPNPFNPSTTFSFTLPTNEFVEITLYNLNGQVVRSVYSGQKTAGTHHLTIDGSDLASGVYFYTIAAGKFNQTKKMVLMR